MGVEEAKPEVNQWENGVEGGTVPDWLGVKESRGVKRGSWWSCQTCCFLARVGYLEEIKYTIMHLFLLLAEYI